MQYKLSYTLFIKHFLEKKLELEFSLYIDEKTQNILYFTDTKDENSYENIYHKVIKIERENANDPNYAKQIWDKISQKSIIKTMLIYYTSLVNYHYENDINYEDTEDQEHLTTKLFPRTFGVFQTSPPFHLLSSHLGHHHPHDTIPMNIIEEFVETIIQTKTPSSPKMQHSQKAYTCVSKYYPSFFEYTYNLKKMNPPISPRTLIPSPQKKTPEEETIAYIHSWMQ